MYILYGGGVTRGVGVEMALAEGALDYGLKVVDTPAGAHRQPEFLALNPADEIIETFPAVRRCYELVCARPKSGPLLSGVREAMAARRDGS